MTTILNTMQVMFDKANEGDLYAILDPVIADNVSSIAVMLENAMSTGEDRINPTLFFNILAQSLTFTLNLGYHYALKELGDAQEIEARENNSPNTNRGYIH